MNATMPIDALRELYLRKYNENRDAIDARIAAGIEQNRKGDCRVCITDKTGAPVAGKTVTVRQLSHDFKLGANLFLLDEFPTEAENASYRQQFAQYFNLATIPFYWNTLEPEEGKPRYPAASPKVYRRPAPDLCMDYCAESGVTPKLHCLFYDKFSPEWLYSADLNHAKAKLEQRFAEISQRYAGKMFEFEVTNELGCYYDRKTVLSTWKDIVPWCYDLARKYFPTDRLTINEGVSPVSIGLADYYNFYYLQCANLLASGAPIDRIGMQNHQFTGVSATTQGEYDASVEGGVVFSDPMLIFRGLDVMAEFGKPLEITEVTVPTFGEGEEYEELQAELLKLWMSVWFSHPAVDTVVYWNTVDGMTFAAPGWNENNCRGGLWHRDLTPKKAAVMLRELFQKTWHTELTLTTDAEGYLDFRGFYGEYEGLWADGRTTFGLHRA